MGKLLRQQRRGKGSPKYRTPSHKHLEKIRYQKDNQGTIIDIKQAPGRKAPVAVVKTKSGNKNIIAAKGMHTGEIIKPLPLSRIPKGSAIYNIEMHYGDGGKICRSSGTYAILISKTGNKCTIQMPSKKRKTLSAKCRAMLGVVAGSGRKEKPFRKAGNKFYEAKTFGKVYPRTSGVAMNAVDHPFGGSASPGRHSTVSRQMPPGKKVGSISPKRTGKKK